MSNPLTVKGRKTRERILNSSVKLFFRGGYPAAGVADICRDSGIAVGGFYRYFSGKDEALETAITCMEEELLARFSALATAQTPEEEARSIANLFFRFVREKRNYYQVMREAEFICEQLSDKFQSFLLKTVAGRFAVFGTGPDTAGILALLGMLSFFAVKHIIWENSNIPADAIENIVAVFSRGVTGRGRTPDFGAVYDKAKILSDSYIGTKSGNNTFNRLLRAAETVFGRQGYAAAHISEITGKAGYATGTFYTCFKSKQEALGNLVVLLRDSLTGRAVHYARLSRTRLETEVFAFAALFDFIREHPYGYRIMREAEFVDKKFGEIYYLYILNNYARAMERTARPSEFSVDNFRNLSLAMMGIGHTFGQNYILRAGNRINRDTFVKLMKAVFCGFGRGSGMRS